MRKNIIFSILLLTISCQSALVKAVQDQNIEQVKEALKSGTNINARSACDMYTTDYFALQTCENALLIAAYNGDSDIVRLLIDAKADLNVKNYYKRTPLLLATDGRDYRQHMEAAKMLIEAGADVNAKDEDGITALTQLARVAMMHAKKYAKAKDLAKLLLERKAEVNVYDKTIHKNTPLLHFSCDPEMVKLIIAAGADVNAISEQGETPITKAASCGSIESVKQLIAAKANVNGGTGKLTALSYASIHSDKKKSAELVKILTAAGAKDRAAMGNTSGGGKVWCVAVVMQKYDTGIGTARTSYAARFVAVSDRSSTATQGQIMQTARQQIAQYSGNGYSEYDSMVTENDDCSQTKNSVRQKYRLSDFTVDQIQKR